MSKYFQDNNGYITIQSGDLIYGAPTEEFIEDIGLPYDMPDGYINSYYEPGISHYMEKKENLTRWSPANRVYLDPIWEKGDMIIGRIENLLAKKRERVEAEVERREQLKRQYLEQQEVSNPLAKYTNFMQALQSAGLMDKLSTSKNMAALTTLILNSGMLFDDEKIESSIKLIMQGMDEPLSGDDVTLFNTILKKNEFEFTI